MTCADTHSHSGYSLCWLADVLRNAGLQVIEQPAWQTRGHGDVGQILGVLCHHTASPHGNNAPALATVTFGRPDLAGPLSQLLLARDGTFYVIAAGKCWHAGAGAWRGVVDGNAHFIGIEAENNGVDEPWPEKQLDAYAHGCAAILGHIKAGAIMCAGHKEYCSPHGRKSDPDFDMTAFRSRVALHMGISAPVVGKSPLAPTRIPQTTKPAVALPKPQQPTILKGSTIMNLNANHINIGSLIGLASVAGAALPKVIELYGTSGIIGAAAFLLFFLMQAFLPVGITQSVEDVAAKGLPSVTALDPALKSQVDAVLKALAEARATAMPSTAT